MHAPQTFDPVFAALYETEEKSDRWSNIAEALNGYLKATTVRISAVRETTGDVLLDALTRDWPKTILSEYDAYYRRIDPRMHTAAKRMGTTITCADLPDPEEFGRSEFVADFLDRPDVDARWGMLQIRRSWDGVRLLVGASRSRALGRFSNGEKREFDAALRHVFHALELDSRLISLGAERDNLAGTLEVDATPTIILTTDLRVLYMNPAAANLVGDGKSLRLINGRLVAARCRGSDVIERVVKCAARSIDGAGTDTAVLRTAEGGRLLARAYALPRSSSLSGTRTAQCVLLLTEGRRTLDKGIDVVLDSYGLTQAECRLVRELLEGASVTQAAATFGVSVETTRSQLKAARAKLGVRRQAELFRLLARYQK